MKLILEQYFIEFSQLDLLTWGSLKWQKKIAFYTDDVINAPKEFILFEPIPSEPSKHFYAYLADALSIPVEQAAIQYEQYIQNLFDGNIEKIELESIGAFTFVNGILHFESHFSSADYYSKIEFEKITNDLEQFDEIVTNKENWILFASIIAILSLLAILFKFYH